jgi:Tfp pilus assembly protein FimT
MFSDHFKHSLAAIAAALAQARAEALEEAAKVADDWENTGMKISTKIRALATPPETEEKEKL